MRQTALAPRLRRALIAWAGAVAFASPVLADSVTLRSTDGTMDVSGELISFDGEYYYVQTALGDLRIAAELMSCTGEGCPQLSSVVADVTIAGSDTVAEGLIPLMVEGFATATGAESRVASASAERAFATTLVGQQGFGEPMGTVEVLSGESAGAFEALAGSTAQLGVSSRRITPDEARAISAAGGGNMIDPAQEHIIAVDSLTVIVNEQNPISSITFADLAGIYLGQITNWSQLGGPDLAIIPVTQRDDAATATFTSGVFGEAENTALFSGFTADDNVAAANYVGSNPGALAYVGFAFKRGQKPLTLVSACGIGATPDAFSVKTEEYALFRRLYLYNRSDLSNELAQNFIDFAESDAAAPVILQAGFIDLAVEALPQDGNGPRASRIRGKGADNFENRVIDDMVQTMSGRDRLSTTFRFRTGSTQLDPRALRDLGRLIAYLETRPQGTEVTFAGFADSVGAFEPNIYLSQGRAQAVLTALQQEGGDRLSHITFNTLGFGEVAPSACNELESGRRINRRVETWMKLP